MFLARSCLHYVICFDGAFQLRSAPISTVLLVAHVVITPELPQEQLESSKTADGGFVYAHGDIDQTGISTSPLFRVSQNKR